MSSRSLAFALGLAAALAGCSGPFNTKFSDAEASTPLVVPAALPQAKEPHPDAYIREVDVHRELSARTVKVDFPQISLTELFRQATPDVPLWVLDAGVDPHLQLQINVDGVPLPDFLDVVSGLTGYDLVLKYSPTPHIEAASVAHRQWTLAAIASVRSALVTYGSNSGSGGSSGNSSGGSGTGNYGTGSAPGNSSSSNSGPYSANSGQSGSGVQAVSNRAATVREVNNEGDSWESVTAFLHSMLATDGKAPVPIGRESDIPPHVVAIRTLGLIDVTGPPSRVREIDRVIRRITTASTQQVHLAVNVYEVTLNDDRQQGIDWTALVDHIKGNMALAGNLALSYPLVGGIANAGTGVIKLGYSKGNQSVNSVINLLGQYGKVSSLNKPDISTINGKTASINSGEEFSYVQSVVNTLNTNSNFQTITPTFTTVEVGVELDVTPRVNEDGAILLDVVPVLSTLNGYDSYTFTGDQYQTPRIAINEMSAEVIAHSGETILLGGLIYRAINDTINHLPGDRTWLDNIFGSTNTGLSRHELVITITPTLVDS